MNTAVAKKHLRQVGNVQELLVNDNARDQLQKVAAKHMSPERMMRIVANAIRTTPTLAASDPMSLLGALMQCASLGLEPNTVLGHAYLIPFKNNRKGITEVQLIVGYKGFIDLARRSGQIDGIHADVVYSDDELWTYEHGSNMHLRHKPGPRQGEKVAAYCHVKLKDGGEAFAVLPWAEIMKTRDNSQGWRTAKRYNREAESPWGKYEDRMASKTAVRALANHGGLPMSIEFQAALEADDTPADFAKFAADPTAGLTIDGELVDDDQGEDGDNTPQDEPEPKKVEEKPKAKAKPKPKPEPKPEPEPAEADGADDGDTDSDDEDDGDQNLEAHQAAFDAVINDLNDGAPVEATLDFHDDALAPMKDEAPKLYAELMEQVKEFE